MQALSVHLGLIKLTKHDSDSEQAYTAPLFTFDAFSHLNSGLQKRLTSNQPQYALLGASSNVLKQKAANEQQVDSQAPDPRIFINISHPHSAFICGSQGSGKSHTLSCLLENCLIPSEVNNLTSPLTALVFHHDSFISDDGGSPCEAAFLSSSQLVSVTVLCSPTNTRTIKHTYSALSNVVVEPLRIQESDLNTKRMLDLMAVKQEDGGAPLYVQTVMRILREMRIDQQNTGESFSYHLFKQRLGLAGLTQQQLVPLQQRLELLEGFMEQPLEYKKKKKSKAQKELQETIWTPQPGKLIIVDLSCPCITPDVACSVFNICLSIFLEQDTPIGRVVALDEAHKYMNSSVEAAAFTESLLSTIRLQRHLGVRVLISTQEPTISAKLLDLSSLVVVHHFTSPQWLTVLQRHIAPVASDMRTDMHAEKDSGFQDGDDVTGTMARFEAQASFKGIFEEIVHLGVGQALLFCPSALIGKVDQIPDSPSSRRLGFGYIKAHVRNRITADGGQSILAL